MSIKVPVGVSNRHVHLSQTDLETLFGPGYKLTVKKELSQPGQFAAKKPWWIGPETDHFECTNPWAGSFPDPSGNFLNRLFYLGIAAQFVTPGI